MRDEQSLMLSPSLSHTIPQPLGVDSPTPILCDLGCSKATDLNENGAPLPYVPGFIMGKATYASPDVTKAKGLEPMDPEKFDVFGLGVCLAEIIMNKIMPWPERFPKILAAGLPSLDNGRIWDEWLSVDKLPHPEVLGLLKGMLNSDPTQRFTMKQVMDHSWVRHDIMQRSDGAQE